jgi:hypothetical protein
MSVIDIGSDAINRATYTGGGGTFIELDNPANLSSIIDSIQIWAYSNITGLKVGTFYFVSGTTYKCRDSATLGSVTAGSKQTFSGLAINVIAGDLLGFYWPAGQGNLELSTSGGAGLLQATGDILTPGASASCTTNANWNVSIYGTGSAPLTGASFLLRMI